jgi:hypothetical protein
MAAFTLESLVLRGVSVLCDEIAVGLRRGTSYAAGAKTPGIQVSMRHAPFAWRPAFNKPAQRPDPVVDTDLVATAAIGTGRSRSRTSVLCLSTAMSAARAVLSRTSRLPGEEQLPVAVRWGRTPAKRVAFGGETLSGRFPTQRPTTRTETGLTGSGTVVQGRTEGKVGLKPASRIPPVSTRGTGLR